MHQSQALQTLKMYGDADFAGLWNAEHTEDAFSV